MPLWLLAGSTDSGGVVDLYWAKVQMPFDPPLQIRFSKKKARERIERRIVPLCCDCHAWMTRIYSAAA
ncbi:MAG TPA: hypothetical protein VMD05_08850 [Candidatus Nanoarchaeia archaeon]|nr:hypothetical protein [Candidatus Nanoarchaeia archaeon]